MRQVIALLGAWMLCVSTSQPVAVNDALIRADSLPAKLSEFRLLDGRTPNFRLQAYTLNTPLFSDYAEKYRAVYVPKGAKARYNAEGVFDFPVGTAIVKSFGYPADLRKPDENVKIIETRLLLRRANGWVALPYVWDADGRDASLKRAGMRVPVSWRDGNGKVQSISYSVPNVNQCKGCHDRAGTLTPIGPKARNLNDGKQLRDWVARDMLDQAPENAPSAPRFDDVKAGVNLRARAYLDVNCGHCHNPKGPANTSGLWLDWNQKADVNLGLNKRPTAAGRGSGDRSFAIAPGKPDQSYLIYRMESLDPGVAMPELGRAAVHVEGVALLRQWIEEMK